MRQRIAAEQPLAVETVAGEEDMEKEGEVSVDGHGDEGESDGEPASEGGGVKIKEGVVVTDDAVVED